MLFNLRMKRVILYVVLEFWFLSRICQSYRVVIIMSEGLQLLTYTRHYYLTNKLQENCTYHDYNFQKLRKKLEIEDNVQFVLGCILLDVLIQC